VTGVAVTHDKYCDHVVARQQPTRPTELCPVDKHMHHYSMALRRHYTYI